jgi:hypothetical protein
MAALSLMSRHTEAIEVLSSSATLNGCGFICDIKGAIRRVSEYSEFRSGWKEIPVHCAINSCMMDLEARVDGTRMVLDSGEIADMVLTQLMLRPQHPERIRELLLASHSRC